MLSCLLSTVLSSALDWIVYLFFLSGTRNQITTCSLHIFSIDRKTQLSHFTFFILNLYGSFGTLSRRTQRRRFSQTHHLLVSLVRVWQNWKEWVGEQDETSSLVNTQPYYTVRATNRWLWRLTKEKRNTLSQLSVTESQTTKKFQAFTWKLLYFLSWFCGSGLACLGDFLHPLVSAVSLGSFQLLHGMVTLLV
jgi:hypothetical protein